MQEPKYKIGDTVFVLESSKISSSTITGALLLKVGQEFSYTYFIYERPDVSAYGWFREDKLFPTKQSLIDSL